MLFDFNLMANRRYNLNNSSRPSGSIGTSTGSTATPPSPTPASGNSTARHSASSGGDSSGKSGVNIPAWIMVIGIAYLAIRGLFIIGSNYIATFDWVIIAILFLLAIISFWNGKNRWLSLILIVAAGCIIWFNQAHIDSSNPNSTEQSAEQPQQVAPAPVEEVPSTERVVVAGRKVTLTGDGTYTVPSGRKSICFTALGKTDGSEISDQTVEIKYRGEKLIYTSLGSKCLIIPDNVVGRIKVDFFPGKSWGEEPVLSNMYKRYASMHGGQGEWPIIRIGE